MVKANNNQLLREKLIKLALLQYKKIYVHGKHGPDTFDCAGLIWYLYHEILDIDIYLNGYGLSTTTKIMTSTYGKINEENINAGDILFFHCQSKKDNEPKKTNKYPGHCGLHLEDDKFIPATSKYGYVEINSLNEEYWKKRLVGSKDIITYIKK